MEFSLLNVITRNLLAMLGNESIAREIPVQWSYMHLFSSIQLAKIIAMKRRSDVELSAVCLALHDIATIQMGIRENHAEIGSGLVQDFLMKMQSENKPVRTLSSYEIQTIIASVKHHSEKQIVSTGAYLELTKDVDTFDRHLHGLSTPPEIFFA